MKKEKMMVIVLTLLIGVMAVGGALTIRHFHIANDSAEAVSLADLDLVKMVSYSCSGGSVAEQSFTFSLQRENEKILFSCEYFENSHDNGNWEKYIVEDAELPAESFTELMWLIANVRFPDGYKEAGDEVLALDAETYSLTVCYASGKRQSLESHSSLSEIEDYFRAIKMTVAAGIVLSADDTAPITVKPNIVIIREQRPE